MTLLCTHHHRLLHEGGFDIVRDEGGTLRFVTADGRSIPRRGYRLEDFVDDDVGDAEEALTSRDLHQASAARAGTLRGRETAAVYRFAGARR